MNKPLGAQYLDYLAGVARGDLGPSLKYKDKSRPADPARRTTRSA